MEDNLRVPDSWVDMVVIGSGKDVSFISSKDCCFIRRENRERVGVVEEAFAVELPGSSEIMSFGPLIAMLLSISEGKDLISDGVQLSVVANVNDVSSLFLKGVSNTYWCVHVVNKLIVRGEK